LNFDINIQAGKYFVDVIYWLLFRSTARFFWAIFVITLCSVVRLV
jgi:hypothetical protein